jgi:hypothetical protein
MRAFFGCCEHTGGIFLEDRSILFTYERRPSESRYTLRDLLAHEFTHYLQGRYLFPGIWGDPDYHDQAKGWLAEGQAELLAGARFGPDGGYELAPLPQHIDEICPTAPEFAGLERLLARREGFDRDGIFDYANAWAFNFFLFPERLPAARRIGAAFRERSYRLSALPELAEAGSIQEVEASWHSSLGRLCAETPRASGGRIASTAAPAASLAPGTDGATGVLHVSAAAFARRRPSAFPSLGVPCPAGARCK